MDRWKAMNTLKCLLVLLCTISAQPALAHSPYFGQSEQLPLNEGKTFALKLLYGDGIFASDPVRAIVVDRELRVRALSPLALKLHIICRLPENERPCVVYDRLTGLVYQPDPETWETGPVIEAYGRPLQDAYPEHMGVAFGFKQRPATYFEIIRFEGDKIKSNPLLAGLTFLWWLLITLLLAPLFWRLYRNMRRIRTCAVSGVSLVFLRLAGATALLLVTFGWREWEPYSLYYAGFFALLASAIGLIVTHPRKAADFE
jgi:hypothetical protein